MAPTDLYQTLGVPRQATPDEIKRAFRRLARRYHPDLNPGDPQAERHFKELQAAYDILSDPQKRAAYDRWGISAFVRGGGAGPGPAAVGKSPNDVLSEILKNLWPAPSLEPRPGDDLRYHLSVSLDEVITGCERVVGVPRQLACVKCRETGSATPDGKKTCGQCQGLGEDRLVMGPLDVKRPCPRCKGSGYEIVVPCPDCGGAGRRTVEEAIKVRIPRGVDAGQRLKVQAKGNEGHRGGKVGDLYVVVHLKRHPTLARQGTELLYELVLSPDQASAGGDVDVPTLGGSATITLPAGCGEGQTFRLKGLGLPALKGHARGDQHVRVSIRQPGDGDGWMGTLSRAARVGAKTLRDGINLVQGRQGDRG